VTRRTSSTLFLAAILAFGLPFGMVSSCDGEQVRFTGVQLATFNVRPDRPQGGTLNREVEHNGSLLAIAVLVTALVGVGIAVSGRRGGGVCASLALAFMQLLGWAILATSDGGGDLFAGFWLALAALAAAAVLHLVLLVRECLQLGHPVWWPAIARIGLVTVLPTFVAFYVASAGNG
jgi:hypothetical protein